MMFDSTDITNEICIVAYVETRATASEIKGGKMFATTEETERQKHREKRARLFGRCE